MRLARMNVAWIRVAPELATSAEYGAGTVMLSTPIPKQRTRTLVVVGDGMANGPRPLTGVSVVTMSRSVPVALPIGHAVEPQLMVNAVPLVGMPLSFAASDVGRAKSSPTLAVEAVKAAKWLPPPGVSVSERLAESGKKPGSAA